MRRMTVPSIALAALLAAACTGPAGPSVAPSASEAAVVSSAPTLAPTATPDPCAAANLTLRTAGSLTIATDNPAYPPYFSDNADGHKTDPWELGDPTNGLGFESAVAYAIADQLGFTKDQVTWTYVPFDNSYKPGPKDFDFDINQVSYAPERAQAVDMSDGYYFVNQAVVSDASNPITKVTSIAALAPFRFGAQVGTTSYSTIGNVIKPSTTISVYDSNDAAISALNAKQIDAIVADLPTAFYMTAAQLDNGAVVGQFPAVADASAEHFSLVLGKDSSLTPCVNAAIAALKADGSLDAITKEWLSEKASAPVLTP